MAQGAGIAYLTAYIGADTVAFRNGMAQVRRDLMDIGGIASGLQDIGKTLTYTITAPIVGAMGVAVSQFAEFEAEMRNIAAISPLVAQDFDGISDTVRRMGQEFRIGADGMAQALYTVQSAGFGLNDVNEALVVTEQAAMLAEAGLSGIVPTTNALVGSLLAYGESADMAQYHSDVLAQTVALGVGSMEGLLTTMSSSLPQAAALGVSFDDLGSTLAFMTQQGFNWARAGTGVGNMLNKLITPSAALKAVYEELGAGSGQELIEMFGGLGGALQEIYNIVGDDPERIRKLFPDDRGFRIALGIFENFDRYTSLLADFDATLDGATDSQRQQQMQSFSYKFDVMKSSIEGFLIVIGQAIAPVLAPFVDQIGALMRSLANANPEDIQLAVILSTIAAAIPPLIWGFGALATPMGLVVTAITGLGALFITNFNQISTVVQGFVANNLPALNDVLTGISGIANFLNSGQTVSDITEAGKTAGEGFVNALGRAITERGDTVFGAVFQSKSGVGLNSEAYNAYREGERSMYGIGKTDTGETGGNGFFDNLGIRIQKAITDLLPQVETAFSTLISQIVTWWQTEGASSLADLAYDVGHWFTSELAPALISTGSDIAPKLATAAGYIVGLLAGSLVGLIKGFFEGTGGIEGGATVEDLRLAFEGGFSQALADLDMTDAGEVILSRVLLALGAVFTVSRIAGIVGGSSAVGGILTGIFGGIATAIKGVGSTLLAPIGHALAGKFTFIMNNLMDSHIGIALESFAGKLFTHLAALLGAGGGTVVGVVATSLTVLSAAIIGAISGVLVWAVLPPSIQNALTDIVTSLADGLSRIISGEDFDLEGFRSGFELALGDAMARVYELITGQETGWWEYAAGQREPEIVIPARFHFQLLPDPNGLWESTDIASIYSMMSEDWALLDSLNPLSPTFGQSMGRNWVDGIKTGAEESLSGLQPTVLPVFQDTAGKITAETVILKDNVKNNLNLMKSDSETQATTLKDNLSTTFKTMVDNISTTIATAAGTWKQGFWNINSALTDPINAIITQMNSLKNAANDALAAIGAASSAPMPTIPASVGGGGGNGGGSTGGGNTVVIVSNNPERIYQQTRNSGVDLTNKGVGGRRAVWGG